MGCDRPQCGLMIRKAGTYVNGSSPSGALTFRQKMLTEIAAGTCPIPAFVTRLSLKVVAMEWRKGLISVHFHIHPDFCVEPDIVFGGFVFSIHDQAAGFAMYSVIEDGMAFSTTQLNMKYLTVTRPGHVCAEAEIDTLDERSAEVRVRLIQDGTVTSESVVAEAIRPQKR